MGFRRSLIALLSGLASLLMAASTGNAAEAHQENFGTMPDGRPVTAITLTNGNKLQVRVISLGATLQSLRAPDRKSLGRCARASHHQRPLALLFLPSCERPA